MNRSAIASAVLMLVAVLAYASSVHFKPPKDKPTFFDGGLYLNGQGELAGLGNGDILVTLSAQANATATCTNPGSGEHQPAGQNPAPVTVAGVQVIPASEIKNGTVTFNVNTRPPITPIAGAPGCPNPRWIEDITDLSFTSALLKVDQPAETTVLQASCTFNPATSNGSVPDGTVTCTVTP